jgi:GNAT superfamily N-acetyltransferase
MTDYRIRPATLADRETLVEQRIAMFKDMGNTFDEETIAASFRAWVTPMMEQGIYKAWLIEDRAGVIVAGGGLTIIPWPPGPRYPGDRLAFVYNVYTAPALRGRGLAKRIMAQIHDFCRAEGITSVALNASEYGQPLYQSLGYQVATSPMMFLSLE